MKPQINRHSKNIPAVLAISLSAMLWVTDSQAQTTTPEQQPIVLESGIINVKVPYVDQLIDPNISEDSFEDLIAKESKQSRLYQNIELKQLFDSPNEQDAIRNATGLDYSAYMATNNFGNFKFNFVLLNHTDYDQQNELLNDRYKDGLSRWSIQQYAFPVTESLSMENHLGIHRLQTHDRFSRNLVSRRFNSVSPEIEGLTTKLFYRNNDLTLSYGRLGQNYGALFTGFDAIDRNLARIKGRHAFDHHLLSAEYWQTSGDESVQQQYQGIDLSGAKLTFDSLYRNNWRSSVTALTSDNEGENNLAALAAVEQSKGRFRQDFGAYYYEPNIIWLDRQIGSDNTGLYYRFNNQRSGYNYGASAELRRDGLKLTENERDTAYFNINLGRRLTRSSRINGFYSLRDVSAKKTESSFTQHYLRSVLNYRSNKNVSNSLSYSHRLRQSDADELDDTYQSLRVSQSRNLKNDSSLDFSLEGSYETQDERTTESYSAQVGWQKEFDNGKSLSAQLGYTTTQSDQGNKDNSWFASANHYWPISDRMTLSTQLGYNRSVYTLEDNEDPFDGLITAPDETDDGLLDNNTRSWSVLFSLNYSTGGQGSGSILSENPHIKGSGKIKGRLFIDENLDGVYQAIEKGLANVDIFLNSIHITKTDANGEFTYPSVGVGNHYLFIDESRMPLPWTINGQEYRPITVNLRKTTRIDVPVTDIPLSDQYTLPDDSLSSAIKN